MMPIIKPRIRALSWRRFSTKTWNCAGATQPSSLPTANPLKLIPILAAHLDRAEVASAVGQIVPLGRIPLPAALHADHDHADVLGLELLTGLQLVAEQRTDHARRPAEVFERMAVGLVAIA